MLYYQLFILLMIKHGIKYKKVTAAGLFPPTAAKIKAFL